VGYNKAHVHGIPLGHTVKVKVMKEILIYGLPKGETRDYMEDLLVCFNDGANTAANIDKVKAAATAAGFHSFRIAAYNGEAPNFAKAVQP
jgi:hypothetical protein